jgi:hypothetical protein
MVRPTPKAVDNVGEFGRESFETRRQDLSHNRKHGCLAKRSEVKPETMRSDFDVFNVAVIVISREVFR